MRGRTSNTSCWTQAATASSKRQARELRLPSSSTPAARPDLQGRLPQLRSRLGSRRRPHGDRKETPVGDWISEAEHRMLVHFSDGGSGMRDYGRPLQVGDELSDGGQLYVVVRVQ